MATKNITSSLALLFALTLLPFAAKAAELQPNPNQPEHALVEGVHAIEDEGATRNNGAFEGRGAIAQSMLEGGDCIIFGDYRPEWE